MMNISGINIGFGKEIEGKISLNIYFAGCKNNKKCNRKECHNPELHNFTAGTPYRDWIDAIYNVLNNNLCNCICYLGGEPFDQNVNDLMNLTNSILTRYPLPIYVYTGYDNTHFFNKYLEKRKFDKIYMGHYEENYQKTII